MATTKPDMSLRGRKILVSKPTDATVEFRLEVLKTIEQYLTITTLLRDVNYQDWAYRGDRSLDDIVWPCLRHSNVTTPIGLQTSIAVVGEKIKELETDIEERRKLDEMKNACRNLKISAEAVDFIIFDRKRVWSDIDNLVEHARHIVELYQKLKEDPSSTGTEEHSQGATESIEAPVSEKGNTSKSKIEDKDS